MLSKPVPGNISGYDRSIYHLLCGAFRQCISVAQIVDLNISDVVTVCNIHITIDIARAGAGFCWRRRGFANWACSLDARSTKDTGKG